MGFIIFIVIIVIAVLIIREVSKQKKSGIVDKLPNFSPSRQHVNAWLGDSIFLDNYRKKVCFMDGQKKTRIYPYKNIIQSEICIDGRTVSRKSVSSAVGRAVVGGVLTGGIGAVIGGATGRSILNEKIKRIDLKITVNKPSSVYKINFLNIEAKKGSSSYKDAMNKAERWHAIILGIMKDQESAPVPVKKTIGGTTPVSVADEIRKMKNLLDEGVITQSEFEQQKAKLLK